MIATITVVTDGESVTRETESVHAMARELTAHREPWQHVVITINGVTVDKSRVQREVGRRFSVHVGGKYRYVNEHAEVIRDLYVSPKLKLVAS